MRSAKLSLVEARRIALAAQGFGKRGQPVDRQRLLGLVRQVGAVQIDSVNVLVRSHYLPAFSRLGAYDPGLLDALWWSKPRVLFEYWGHEASILPVELQPLFRFRMAEARDRAWGFVRRIAKEQPAFVEEALAVVRERGPIAAGDLGIGGRRSGGFWGWSEAKRAVEFLFWSGQVAVAGRRGFERLYDLPERVLPAQVLHAPDPPDPHRELIERAARALGVATEADLRDYFRLAPGPARKAIATLEHDGVLCRASVEGWERPAWLHRDAQPGNPGSVALLSPFDSLIWTRPRTERLFGMKFRLEIYTPAHKRVHGYYVLLFLLGASLVARVDLKADRERSTLLVQAAHLEPGAKSARVAAALAGELSLLAGFLELESVRMNGF